MLAEYSAHARMSTFLGRRILYRVFKSSALAVQLFITVRWCLLLLSFYSRGIATRRLMKVQQYYHLFHKLYIIDTRYDVILSSIVFRTHRRVRNTLYIKTYFNKRSAERMRRLKHMTSFVMAANNHVKQQFIWKFTKYIEIKYA